MSHAGRFLSPWLLALAVTAMTASEQKVTASPPAHLSADQAADFQQALTTLANQGHVTIVAEGTPLSSMPALDAAKLTAAAFLEDQIQTIADSYDYSVQRHGSVFVLRKRYSNPDDLPAVTPAECVHVLAQLPQIAEPFNPHGLSSHIQFLAPPGPNLRRDQVRILHPLIDAFADSLTADQNAAMQGHNLLVSSLTESQKTLARRLQLSLYVQSPMDNIALLPPKLKQAEQSALFCWQDTYNTHHVFGYTLPEQVNSQTIVRFHPLSHVAGWEDLGEGGLDPSPTGPDPTNPAQAPVQADTHPETLTEVVAALSVRPGAIHTDVDAAVAAKPVVLVGVGNASVSEVLHALADVYGLSLSAHHGALALTLPNVAPPAHLADLSATLRKTLPEPFARATHLTHIVEEEQNFYDFWRLPHPEYNDWVMQRHGRVSRRERRLPGRIGAHQAGKFRLSGAAYCGCPATPCVDRAKAATASERHCNF